MSSDTIDYGNLMHRAMRSLIKEVLNDIAKDGLPGQHHFFITFDTMHPDVEIADWLSDRYPGDMTIVIQHWFDNLDVGDVGFAITLNFGDNPEPLYVPYDAIVTFVDPSVEFGLRFDSGEDGKQDAEVVSIETAEHEDVPEAPMVEALDDDEPPKDAEVVSLDSFRKP
ncbi:MAG: ClpXP protease specificity-enhancing factor SspB [Marinosulfonomonas sp.]|nr:ClpXP protease specificity-enhancing factor SspB [Marinosulfonomonas sp.]